MTNTNQEVIIQPFYTVIVIDTGAFESIISDERHFAKQEDAERFARNAKRINNVTITLQIK